MRYTTMRDSTRVVHIDSIGIVLASNGNDIMPGFDDGRDELTLPMTGDLFPWTAMKRVSFVCTGAQYEQEWRELRAKETVYMDANDLRFPASNAEYQAWERQQDRTDFRRRLQDAVDAEARGGN